MSNRPLKSVLQFTTSEFEFGKILYGKNKPIYHDYVLLFSS